MKNRFETAIGDRRFGALAHSTLRIISNCQLISFSRQQSVLVAILAICLTAFLTSSRKFDPDKTRNHNQ